MTRFGARALSRGQTEFRVWSPSRLQVGIRTPEGTTHWLAAEDGGWHAAVLPLGIGTRYRCVVVSDDGTEAEVSDPASRAQDGDVHGYSVVVDPDAYRWRHDDWRGRPWHEAVVYELHAGLLGGFEGIEERLAAIAELGVTAIELMPVSDFPGSRNWGYDGVLPFAPDSSYGTPDQLKHLVDCAHGHGLMVFLDVVYNHFGPDGNSVTTVAPEFFRDDVDTPWGPAIDFRRPEVCSFFTENAIQWVVDYRFDGLRFDAIHAIAPSEWLDDMAQAIRSAAGPERHVHLVLENDDNEAAHLEPGRRCFDAQWNDDAHHVLHVLLTGESDGYYSDYADQPGERLARVLAEGFAYQGDPSAFRDGAPRGTPSAHLQPTAFVDCLQNHDQIGNRPLGERLTSLADPDLLRAAVGLLLLSPHIPLIFMGEEFGSCDPFLYFTSHNDELAALVREGRRNEFAAFMEKHDEDKAALPDPNDPRTFETSRPAPDSHARSTRDMYRELLALRRRHVVPGLPGCRSLGATALGEKAVAATWRLGDGTRLVIAVNLGAEKVDWSNAPDQAALLHASGAGVASGRLAARSMVAYRLPGLPGDLQALAKAAGLQTVWTDHAGTARFTSERTVRSVLEALGHPNREAAEVQRSLAAIRCAEEGPRFLTACVGGSVEVPVPHTLEGAAIVARLSLESGAVREVDVRLRTGSTETGWARVDVAVGDEPGYHELRVSAGDWSCAIRLAVAPQRAFEVASRRMWGTAVQLYALRPEPARRSMGGGIGDYSGLAEFVCQAAASGAQAVAVSPTHAGFSADPSQASPYSPSSRLFYHVVHIDPAAEFGAGPAEDAARRAGLLPTLGSLEELAEVDWPAAGAAKLRWLRAIFDGRAEHAAPPAGALERHARFEALHAHFLAEGRNGWLQWPPEFHDPESPAVARFATDNATEVRFHAWLQQAAANGLERVQRAALEHGMAIGVISDVAIGMSPSGSHAWSSQAQSLVGLEIGAPPDLWNPTGQGWGLTTWSPSTLRATGFESFLATLRTAMRFAGGVRIDHVLGLGRLWLIPQGSVPAEGVFVRYPLDDLLNLLVLESHRARAIVIGEDLGTVPPDFRRRMAERGVLGMSVLWLETSPDTEGFRPPGEWPASSVAMTTTHDLPTAAGWWQGRDLEWRGKLDAAWDMPGAKATRDRLRAALTALAPVQAPVPAPDAQAGPSAEPRADGPVHGIDGIDGVDLAIEVVARAPAPVAIIPVEDLLGLPEQPNFPGTTDQHPNWRRRLPAGATALFADADVRRRVARLNRLRGADR